MSNKFDWDRYLREETYNKVLEGMEDVRKIIPTMFSPDKKLIYLKTQDLDFETGDKASLTSLLDELLEELRLESSRIKWSFERLYLLQIDFRIVYLLLSNLDALPADSEPPETHLEKIVKLINAKK